MKYIAFVFVPLLFLTGCQNVLNQLPSFSKEKLSSYENTPHCTENSSGEYCNAEKMPVETNGKKNMMGSGMGMGRNMKGGEVQNQFSYDPSELPEVEPTKMVSLKDGDTFELHAEMVQQEMGNRIIKRLAYNRQIPGPIIQVEKGATITLKFTNNLDIPTTLHSHGVRLNDDFDGVPVEMGGTQQPVNPGESFEYTLTFPDSGVYWYHPHMREDYTQEMGLYGNFSVTEDNYWTSVDQEVFLVLDDFSENDPFYKDFTNKSLMGRFGNIFLINNQENFQMNANTGETFRFFVTNTANTRTFDFTIWDPSGKKIDLKVVGGDVGKVENEFLAKNFIIAPAERIIFETAFIEPGIYTIKHRGKIMGKIQVIGNRVTSPSISLQKNSDDYLMIRENFQKFLEAPIDKNLRLTIKLGMMGEKNGMKMMEDNDPIEWEDAMPQMNTMSTDQMVEWIISDETDSAHPKENIDMNPDWKFTEGDLVKIKIFNDPNSAHPMQHPIHFHGQRFVVLTRDGVPNDNLQWKDTTLIQKGETLEILVEMSNPGKWIAHCHIAEHMHAGMMFNFEIAEK